MTAAEPKILCCYSIMFCVVFFFFSFLFFRFVFSVLSVVKGFPYFGVKYSKASFVVDVGLLSSVLLQCETSRGGLDGSCKAFVSYC